MSDGTIHGCGLELIGTCNANCRFCVHKYVKPIYSTNVFTGEVVEHTPEKISYSLIDGILETHNIGAIICTGVSEPFLAKDRIRYLIEKTKEYKFSLSFFTNGTLVDEEITKELLDCKYVASINFSLNASTDEVRRQVMGLPLEKSEEALKRFIRLRDEKSRQDIAVGMTMMLTSENRSDEKQFRNKWKGPCLSANVGPPGCFYATNWNNGVEDYWMSYVRPGGAACRQWSSNAPTISAQGQIYMCCYGPQWSFGHVLNKDATKKWLDKKSIFNVVDETNPDDYPDKLCGGCSHRFGSAWK